jgi:pimeloyl-ACP methyl ester carboxylesterase
VPGTVQRGIIAVVTETLHLPTPDGRSIDVWLAGPADGEAVVFHSGTPGNGMPFSWHVENMAERGLRYVSVTRPGYGSSTRLAGRRVADVVPDTRFVLDHLGIDKAWILGWSGGGPHALACAALMPERVRGTALIAGVAPYPAEGLDWFAGMGAENVEEFKAALAGHEALMPFMQPLADLFGKVTPTEVADSFGSLIDDVDRGSLTGELADYVAGLFREAFRTGYWGIFDDDIAFSTPWGFDVGSIRGPVDIWQGAHDRMVPFGHGQWLAAHVGHARAHLFQEQGHLTLVVDAYPQILDALIGGPS